MNLANRNLLEKLRKKNKENIALGKAIDGLISDILNNNWNSPLELKISRPDADCVHSDGFYFLDLAVHRIMVLI